MNRKLKQIADLNQQKSIEKSKKNLNRMIFYNSLIYIVSHLPEFFTTIFLIAFSRKISNFCYFNVSCDLINEEAEFFGLISMACQFYVFKIFDRNFCSSFNDLKWKLRSCFQKNETKVIYTVELKHVRELIGDGRIEWIYNSHVKTQVWFLSFEWIFVI